MALIVQAARLKIDGRVYGPGDKLTQKDAAAVNVEALLEGGSLIDDKPAAAKKDADGE